MSDKVYNAAAAIELLHIASLVHDDIIDGAGTRRGVKTINAEEGVFTAILAGDYLLAKAFESAALVDQQVAGAQAVTFATMCNGQGQELADRYNLSRTANSYLEVIRNKTAGLFSLACQMGSVCADLPQEQVAALIEFGESFGMAFQIADDLLDLDSKNKSSGKSIQNDIKEGVYTLPVLLCLQSTEAGVLKKILEKRLLESKDTREITKLLESSGSIDKTIEVAKYYNQKASSALKILEQTTAVRTMAKLPTTYLDLALKSR